MKSPALLLLFSVVVIDPNIIVRDRIGNGEPTVEGEHGIELSTCLHARETEENQNFNQLPPIEQSHWIQDCLQRFPIPIIPDNHLITPTRLDGVT